MVKRLLTRLTDTIYEMPVLVLMPHSRCNCRCVMCDIWKANNDKKEISEEALQKHIKAFKKLGVKRVALSGGEALMHPNLWKLCGQLKDIGIKISLLSTGITLKAHAADVVKHTDDVIVSLDGSPELHNRIRNLPSAFSKLSEGVQAIKDLEPYFPVTGRCVIQRLNYQHFTDIIATAKSLDLDQISFLAADVSSSAFNRPQPWEEEKVVQVELNEKEVREFERIVKDSFRQFTDLYHNKYIAESPEKMIDIVNYYKGLLGTHDFPKKICNAPWVSAVIEADGEVKPCFFHASYGNINNDNFIDIINSPSAISFRKKLNMEKDPVCERCVCSLYVGLTASP
jgi:MoaA/NifB/PqqE/SkfB family radical SAM enzyme